MAEGPSEHQHDQGEADQDEQGRPDQLREEERPGDGPADRVVAHASENWTTTLMSSAGGRGRFRDPERREHHQRRPDMTRLGP